MSLSSQNMMKLMAYADGELDGAERTEAEMLLASSVEAVSFVEQIAGLGELVELGHEARSGKAIESFDVADAVMAAIQVSRGSAAAQVSRGSGPRAPEMSVSAAAGAGERGSAAAGMSKVGSLAAAREKKGNGLKIGAGIAAALALAASIFVFAHRGGEETPMAIAPSVQPATNGVPGTGVAIESAGKSVSVFYLPTANELSTSVVVWVDETGEK